MSFDTPTPRDPDVLITLPLIPTHRLKLLREKLATPSRQQKRAIQSILNMRRDVPFMQCRGKNHTFVRKCEAKGDTSHSAKKHRCQECACPHVAGQGTRGNFYGLGPETGHLGVGYCRWCQQAYKIRPAVALRLARRQVQLVQRYGVDAVDTDLELTIEREETAIAKRRIEAREELQLVVDELRKLRGKLEGEKRPTMYVSHGKDGSALEPVDDKTLFDMKMRAAATISKLKLDDLKLSADKFLLVDHVMIAADEIQQAVREAIAKTDEMRIAKSVRGEELETETPIQDYVWNIFANQWAKIWMRLKAQAGRTK